MDFYIRELKHEEFEKASALIWKTFYAFDSAGYTMAGMEKFRDVTSTVSLQINSFDGRMNVYGAFAEEDALIGVCAVRIKTYPEDGKDFVNEKNHLTLLFVDGAYHKNGVGKALAEKAVSDAKKALAAHGEKDGGAITVNSSDQAVGFYEKLGFVKTGERRVEDGIISTPMRLDLPPRIMRLE